MSTIKRIESFLKGNFGKSILTLTSGTLIAQIITIIVSPLLTRLFTPAEMGFYTLILTAESMFGGIICGRYDIAIVSEKEEENVLPLMKLSFVVTILMSIIATLIYGIIYFNGKVFSANSVYGFLFVLFFLILNGVTRILESYNNRYRQYNIMNTAYIGRTFTQNFSSLLFGVLRVGVWGLLFSHFLGLIVGIQKQSKKIKSRLLKIRKIGKNDIIKVMRKHYRQPLFSVPAIFANRFSYSSINLFMELLFGLSVLGHYSISYKALGLPLNVMSNNVSKVFYKDAVQEFEQHGNYKISFFKTSIFLTILAVPMFLGMYFVVPPLFGYLFGEGWEAAGLFVKILAPMFSLRFVTVTVANGLQITGKQKVELAIQCLFIIASLTSYSYTRYFKLMPEDYLYAINLSFSFIYILYYLIVMRDSSTKRRV